MFPRILSWAAARASSLVFAVLIATIPIACTTPEKPIDSDTVVVSILPQKYFVERIAGETLSVEVVVSPGQSPATYAPSPKQVARLGGASTWFLAGVPFESAWRERIVRTNRELKLVDLGRDFSGVAEDPHAWTSPGNVRLMAIEIHDALAAEYPEHAEQFADGLVDFTNELGALDAAVRDRLTALPGRAFMVHHPAWGHFAEAYGLIQIAVETDGKEPGPRRLAQVIEEGRSAGVTVMLIQEQSSDDSARVVADALQIPIRRVDPLEENYNESITRFVEALVGGEDNE